jgi:hypothetical protein
MCCLCFGRFRVADLSETVDGDKQDVCVECAENEKEVAKSNTSDSGSAARGWNGTLRLPFEWAILVSLHPRWKDKDGCRWHVQAWHPLRRGFVLSRLGVVR